MSATPRRRDPTPGARAATAGLATLGALAALAALAAVSLLATPALAAPPAGRFDPGLLEGGSLVLYPEAGGVRLELALGANADLSRVRARLLAPDDRSGALRRLDLAPGAAASVLLRRPPGSWQDRDLRVELTAVHGGATRRWIQVAAAVLVAPRLVLLGDTSLWAGATWSPRLALRLSEPGCEGLQCGAGPAGVPVTARLVARDQVGRLVAKASAVSDASGGVPLTLAIPRDVVGPHRLEVRAAVPGPALELTFDVNVERGLRVLLSTDKPFYQPGQTMHLRLLARDRGAGGAAGGAPAVFRVFDARDNKILEEVGRTSPEGVFAATLDLADLVNVGRWRVVAEVAGEETERAVEVRPYVLPKFNVEITPERRVWRPGETARGTVSARYFFDKPVAGGIAVVRAEVASAGVHEVARLELQLDADGRAAFELPIPTVLAGTPALQGAASLHLRANVIDTAGQRHHATHRVIVAADPYLFTALPEAGELVPGLENAVYILVTEPDGAPVEGLAVVIHRHGGAAPVTVVTDHAGVAEWRAVLGASDRLLTLEARGPGGALARRDVNLPVAGGDDTPRLLLRVDDPVPRAGDTVGFDVLVSGAIPHVFLDLVRDGQTLLTLSAPAEGGRARFRATLPPEAAGTLLAHAYVIGPDLEVWADTRPLVVRDATELRVEVRPDRETYRPGERAAIDLRVTDAEGHPVLAALGLWVVDEAVFALSEVHPGMERAFFLLERELLTPRIQVQGLDLADVMLPSPDAPRPPADSHRAARALAAAAAPRFTHAQRRDSLVASLERSDATWNEAASRRVRPLRRALEAHVVASGGKGLDHRRVIRIARALNLTTEDPEGPASLRDLRGYDPFGAPWVIETHHDVPVSTVSVISRGPDGVLGTADDIVVTIDLYEAYQRFWANSPRAAQWGWGVGSMGGGAGGGGLGFRSSGPIPMIVGTASVTEPRLRSDFPETLYVDPLLITDADGRARLDLPLADSITTWRLTALASAASGALGSTSHGIRVFQDFFVDVDLPVSITRGDEVAIPVVLYNYLPERQTVRLTVSTTRGVELAGAAELALELAPDEVRGIHLPLRGVEVGTSQITVLARGTHLADAVRRDLRVEPDGFPLETTRSGILDRPFAFDLDVPEGAIPSADSLLVRLYPGVFAQIVDGLESILRMPSGCFEQTSSANYPNILVLRYLRGAERANPELEARALGLLQAGWQRLVTFEVRGGGFSWFGEAPANQILTAYGLMQFHDLAEVLPIDAEVSRRTRVWLAGRQRPDGAFDPDATFLHVNAWGDVQRSRTLVTAYIAWALAITRPERDKLDAALRKALDYLADQLDDAEDPYVLAYLANAFAEANADRRPSPRDAGLLNAALAKLAARAITDDDGVHFPTELRTATYGSGLSARVEVTALALRALMRARSHRELVQPALAWLAAHRDGHGTWHSTQATVQALKAIVASQSSRPRLEEGAVTVTVNGQPVATVEYTGDDRDVVRYVDATPWLRPGPNRVELNPSEGLEPSFAALGRSHLPWSDPRRPPAEAFEVDVAYERTDLATHDEVGVRVTVRSNLPVPATMGIVDVGVPPGFEVVPDGLDAAVEAGVLQRYTVAGRQLILYVPEFSPETPFEVTFALRARFPVKVSAGAAVAYEYYDPDQRGQATPSTVTVR